MTFVSYAQNLEDVMLFRALKHIEHGFYVDIGAFSPSDDSITKAFYERLWSGINVEPNPQRIEELLKARDRDINLGVAVSDKEGFIKLFVVSDTGLTTVEQDLARQHQSSGWAHEEIGVPCRTLTGVLDEHVAIGQEIHFLKIDVEGHETAVLRGLDLKKYRPWIILIEATLPLSITTNHSDWEHHVVKCGYLFAYWDGLNRFYVAQEHSELLSAFSAPPNVFDDYQSVKQFTATNLVKEIEAQVIKQGTCISELEARLKTAKAIGLMERSVLKELHGPERRGLLNFLLFRKSGRPRRFTEKVIVGRSGKIRPAFKPLIRFCLDRLTEVAKNNQTIDLPRQTE